MELGTSHVVFITDTNHIRVGIVPVQYGIGKSAVAEISPAGIRVPAGGTP